MPPERIRRKPERQQWLLMMPPAIVAAIRERAKFETAQNGGAIRTGGKGVVTVSDLVERILRDRMRPKPTTGQIDQPA